MIIIKRQGMHVFSRCIHVHRSPDAFMCISTSVAAIEFICGRSQLLLVPDFILLF
jgi:hypothetical protein